jgi:phosphatidylglycerol:prolipoprotein diacylglycerol transferase
VVSAAPSAPSSSAESPAATEEVLPQALIVTHWFEPGTEGDPYPATVRLTGERLGVTGRPAAGDRFTQEDKLEGIVPGSGPVSITSWIYGVEPGEWHVSAELIRPLNHGGTQRLPERRERVGSEPLRQGVWSWLRWRMSEGESAPVKTRWAMVAPLLGMPAVMPGIWPALGTLGAIVGMLVQTSLLAHDNIAPDRSVPVLLFAFLSGLVGAKVWYAVLHPGPWRQAIKGGWAVDGFLVVALLVAVAAVLASNLPLGTFFDDATPGLFVGVAIGRIGCFFTGCCAGRCTTSRWGIWSSDRRIGARRVPAQLLESAAGLLLAVVTGLLVLSDSVGVEGLIFVGGFGSYLVLRQLLLRSRAERREFSWRRNAAVARSR